jgi:replicative DNA helicase
MPRIAIRERLVKQEPAGSDEPLQTALSENLITLMCHSNEHGKVVAGLVQPHQFENEVHRTLAQRAAEYWRQHGQAPGAAHTADLVDDIISDPNNKRAATYRGVLNNMLALWDNGINTAYVLEEIHAFRRMQEFKRALLQSADALSAKQHLAIGEVEDMWRQLLRQQPRPAFERGERLDDIDGFVAELRRQDEREFNSGIALLDHRYVVPTRGLLSLLLGAVSAGKSWYLINVGKWALRQHQKVLHITLEMPSRSVRGRYHQNFHALARWPEKLTTIVTRLQLDDAGQLVGFARQPLTARFCVDRDPQLAKQLKRLYRYPHLLRNLLVKFFPPQTLTVSQLQAYLDQLELVDKFVPDLILLDYVGLMKTAADNQRIDLGRTVMELRALASERQCAVVTAHQVNREAQKAKIIGREHVAEDFSMIATADFVLLLNASEREQQLGLARLWVDKGRETEHGFGAVLSQNYAHGQFVLQSAPLVSEPYWRLVDTFTGHQPTSSNAGQQRWRR